MSDTSLLTTKNLPETTVVAVTRQVTISEISPTAEVCVPELYQAAKNANLSVIGPCTFIYDGCNSDGTTPIYLTIAIPVDAPPDTVITDAAIADIHICQLPPCQCVCIQHTGGIDNISDTYQKIFEQANSKNIKLHCEHTREVYHHWVDYDSTDNQTEIQVAIDPAA